MNTRLISFISERIAPNEFTSKDLEQVIAATGLPIQSIATRLTIDSVVREALVSNSALQFRPGGWVVSVTGAATHGVVCSALLWGILSQCGLGANLTAALVPSVLSLFFKIDRVTLTMGEEDIALRLEQTSAMLEKTAEELYESLDASERAHLNYFDFLDCLEKLRSAGRASKESGYWKILPADKQRFRIEIV